MTSSAQLTFAELIDRGVPLSAAEAAALVLAVSTFPHAVPAEDDILLSSIGEVRCEPPDPRTPGPSDSRSFGPPDPRQLALLLHRLLRLDEPGGGERRGRIPGGLLVVLARTLRQIDLPPLSSDAFHDALERFARSDQPGALAAVFWRAARMRPRGPRRLTWGRPAASPARRERRTQGPTVAELRHWLRQSEQELFRQRRSRAATMGAAAMLVAIVMAILGIGAAIGDRPDRTVAAQPPAPPVVAVPASVVIEPEPAEPAAEPVEWRRPAADRGGRLPPWRNASAVHRSLGEGGQPAQSVRRPSERRTVEMVNLPRTPWAVVRRLDTAAGR